MFFKINQLKTLLSPLKIILLVIFFAFVFFVYQLISENRFSEQENKLYDSLMKELVNQEVCTDTSTCATKIHFYRKSTNRIYFNMYNQTDMALIAKIGKFLVKDGIKLSEGKPLTLKVYAGPKLGYFDTEYYFGHEDPLLTLEIEK